MRPYVFFVCLSAGAVLLGNLYCKGRGDEPARGDAPVRRGDAQGQKGDHSYENRTEKPRTVELPDGSRVLVGAHTVLFLSKAFDETKRELDLDGEAVFEIAAAPGKPFIVHTRLLEIEALGTRFRVEAHREDAGEQVELLEGKLRVRKSYHSDSDNEPEELTTGEMVMINRDIDLMEKEKMDSSDWKRAKGGQ